MSDDKKTEKPKRKRGRPKGSKNKPKKEEPQKDEPKKEEPQKDEPKKEEPQKDEPKKEEPQKDEPKKEEPQKEETTDLEKKEEKPKPKEYSKEEIEAIAKRVETPSDQTPPYQPKIVLDKKFGGTSAYEAGIKTLQEELEDKLAKLQNDPEANTQEVKLVKEDLKTLDYLYENYYQGMNVFRTAKGGRAKLRE